MTPVVNYLTPELIEKRRKDLLARTPLSFEELRRRAGSYMLDADEESILRALEDLEYLETRN